jgi:hypothetical protein
MAIRIVDLLEVVKVERQQGKIGAEALALSELVFKPTAA